MAFDEVGMLDENDFVGALSLGGRGGIIIIGCEEMTAELGAQIARPAGDYNGAAIAAAHDYAGLLLLSHPEIQVRRKIQKILPNDVSKTPKVSTLRMCFCRTSPQTFRWNR